jgi:adenylate kinase family enzyme
LSAASSSAPQDAEAAGQPVRKDDNPAVFEERLREYYKKTAPLIGYYYAKGMLKERRRHGRHRCGDRPDRDHTGNGSNS